MINNLVILTCHCDTEKKQKVLVDNINLLKQNGHHVLLVSHIPIPLEIQQKAEYFIYDKNNPILSPPLRQFRYWNHRHHPSKPGKEISLQVIMSDYGWTVFNQYIKSGKFILNLDYDYFSFINYDIVLTKGILQELLNPSHNFIASKVQDSNEDERWPSLVFSIIEKEQFRNLLPTFRLEDYVKIRKDSIWAVFPTAEDYWRVLLSRFNYKVFDEVIKDKIDFGTPNIFNQNTYNDLFRIFFEKSNNPKFLSRYFKEDKPIDFKINDEIIKLEPKETLYNLPKKIDKIGFYDYKGKYYCLLNEYNKSDNQTISEKEA